MIQGLKYFSFMKSEKCGVRSSSSGFSDFRLLGFLFLEQNSGPTGSSQLNWALGLLEKPSSSMESPGDRSAQGPVCSAGSGSDLSGLRYLFRKKKFTDFIFQHLTSIMTF